MKFSFFLFLPTDNNFVLHRDLLLLLRQRFLHHGHPSDRPISHTQIQIRETVQHRIRKRHGIGKARAQMLRKI